MWKQLVKIQNSQLSIDRNHEEKFNKQSGWLDRFSILVWSIEKANSINQKEFLISQNFNKFIINSRVDWIDSRFLFDQSERNIRSIEENSRSVETHKTEFPEFSPSSFQRFFMNKLLSYEHNRLSLRSKLNTIDTIALRFNLTYLISNLNIIITLNISFYKIIISKTM